MGKPSCPRNRPQTTELDDSPAPQALTCCGSVRCRVVSLGLDCVAIRAVSVPGRLATTPPQSVRRNTCGCGGLRRLALGGGLGLLFEQLRVIGRLHVADLRGLARRWRSPSGTMRSNTWLKRSDKAFGERVQIRCPYPKSPFSLRALMERPTADRLLGDDAGVAIPPPDPTNMGALARRTPARDSLPYGTSCRYRNATHEILLTVLSKWLRPADVDRSC